ncbi:hypothetical protein EJB05_04103, partial [Eragrostis curvula]
MRWERCLHQFEGRSASPSSRASLPLHILFPCQRQEAAKPAATATANRCVTCRKKVGADGVPVPMRRHVLQSTFEGEVSSSVSREIGVSVKHSIPSSLLVHILFPCEPVLVGLTGFRYRCGGTFCGSHRYTDAHACGFDYKAAGREQIAKQNPLVVAAKIA